MSATCEHGIPWSSCGACWPEHVVALKDAEIAGLKAEVLNLKAETKRLWALVDTYAKARVMPMPKRTTKGAA